MKNGKFYLVTSLAVFCLFFLQAAEAHEFIVKPESMSARQGQKIALSVISSHVFMVSDEVEPIDEVEVYTLSAKRKDVSLEINASERTLDGSIVMDGTESCYLCGHRKPMIWTKTTEGWKQESKKNLSGVISSGQYEKFSKAFIGGEDKDNNFNKPVGHRLEVIPVTNPRNLKIGDELQVKILFDGKPIATDISATFAGFSSAPNTYASVSETSDKGLGKVKITANGTWMVRVEHKINESTEDYDQHVLRAVFLFGVGAGEV
ncbi:MAG: hypothetical protein COA36_03085 [Desulfotalea sp.]|nr:MAG: hypothetical protein COA36_03085 [Desulfotalea sp.]